MAVELVQLLSESSVSRSQESTSSSSSLIPSSVETKALPSSKPGAAGIAAAGSGSTDTRWCLCVFAECTFASQNEPVYCMTCKDTQHQNGSKPCFALHGIHRMTWAVGELLPTASCLKRITDHL